MTNDASVARMRGLGAISRYEDAFLQPLLVERLPKGAKLAVERGLIVSVRADFDRPLLYQVLPVNIIFSPVGTLGRERVTQLLSKERIGYLQGLPSCCHLLWDSQTPQSTEIHMLRCVYPGPA